MISYAKLWILLQKQGKKRFDLVEDGVIARGTLTKLGKNDSVTTDTISKICDYLDCQPGDIMERVTKEQVEETVKVMNQKFEEMFDMLSAATGKSREELLSEAAIQSQAILKKLQNGEQITLEDTIDPAE
ncbi:MAG TPA: helix-turn-helix transcriptional regulator [Firmicutes bacterium]|nr:helix-turn-helix transcriptional regulator [Bacillota bacterium]